MNRGKSGPYAYCSMRAAARTSKWPEPNGRNRTPMIVRVAQRNRRRWREKGRKNHGNRKANWGRAARRNVSKAAASARKKTTIGRLPKKTRTALCKEGAKAARRKGRLGWS